jgi:mannose-6-phosphate isomerase-like protein (cupin superfamily)
MAAEARETVKGDGWAVGSVDGMGDGPGFRKVRRELDVTAFGANVIVLPEGYDAGTHYHEEQEELYLVLRGTIEIEFGDGQTFTLGEGGTSGT